MAWPMVFTGAAIVPAAVSLPAGETNTPNASLITQGSVVVEGTSESAMQSAPQTWYPGEHEMRHTIGDVHVAVPFPDGGGGHALLHEPQCAGCVGSTHAPLQSRGADPSGSHETPHTPFEQVPWPSPPSGPEQTLSQVPQCAGRVGSTQPPGHERDLGAMHVGPVSAAPSPASTLPASLTTITSTGEIASASAPASSPGQSPRDAQS